LNEKAFSSALYLEASGEYAGEPGYPPFPPAARSHQNVVLMYVLLGPIGSRFNLFYYYFVSPETPVSLFLEHPMDSVYRHQYLPVPRIALNALSRMPAFARHPVRCF